MKISLPSPTRRTALAIGLGCVLMMAYLLTFNGIPKANDELWLADTAQSVALRGETILNQTQFTSVGHITSDVEPLQPLLAAPLYWIGYHLPWAGNMHTLYLFNPVVTALTAILLFYYALLLGYQERTALIAGLLFGLTTIAWPYSRTFFREPLAGLNLLAAAYVWERWRRSFSMGSPRRWWWFAGGAAVTCLTLLSKEAAVFVLPTLALIGWPDAPALRKPGRDRTILMIAGGAAALGVLALAVISLSTRGSGVRSDFVPQLISTLFDGLAWVPQGVAGLLISPGRGMWWFSPVLLLALASPALLPRARWRESWLILATLLVFTAAYSGVRRDLWFGGAGWGARFMVPLAPLLMLAALPGIDWMLNSARRWPKIALGALAVIGLGVQIVGVYVDVYDYSAYLEASTGQSAWLGPGIWSVRWSQIIGGLLYMPQTHTDMMWFYKGVDWLALGALGIGAAIVTGALWLAWRSREDRRWPARIAAWGGPLLVIVMAAFTLFMSLPDVRYKEATRDIEELQGALENIAGPEDTVMLSNWHYSSYFMNMYKGRAIWWGLPNPPGERFSPEQPAEVVSDNLEDLVGKRPLRVITQYLPGGARYNGRPIWLVGDASSFLTWATRPVEHYLAENAYFVSATDYASNVRLTEFVPLPVPEDGAAPAVATDAKFGDSIRLVGYDLSQYPGDKTAHTLRPGAALGVSLLWESIAPVTADYTVAVHLIGPDGAVVIQQDRQPVAGFSPTSGWNAGDRVRDNFGFVLPDTLPAGAYQLWVTIYSWPSLEKLSVGGADHLVIATLAVKD